MTKRPWNINDALGRIGEKHGETLRRLADGEGAAWTDKDTEALRTGHTGRHDWERAADHIEALEKQLADFKAGAEAEARAGDDARELVRVLKRECAALREANNSFGEPWRDGYSAGLRDALGAVNAVSLGAHNRALDAERGSVVRWLRSQGALAEDPAVAGYGVRLFQFAADAIERGEHLK